MRVAADQILNYMINKQLLNDDGSLPASRRELKKIMILAQQELELVKKLNLRITFVTSMLRFYCCAVEAKKMNIEIKNDPEVFKEEAFKYAKMFGDSDIHFYNKFFAN